ncbi:MAG: Tim44 domain-containing protein [Chitinophagaceae bacterium]|nr:Tim44 domain-containing protein [Oligoflexus sp.]
MMNIRLKSSMWIKSALFVAIYASLAQIALPTVAEARAGSGRSFGRTMSRPAPSRQYVPQASRAPVAAPAPNPQYNPQPQRGGFMRGMAGGLAGGFLGSMLFNSMGHASGGADGYAGGAGGGGIGLFDIILIAGFAYLLFRWWKSRQIPTTPSAGALGTNVSNFDSYSGKSYGSGDQGGVGYYAKAAPVETIVETIDPEEASDIFFKVQAAWTRRDLASVTDRLGPEVYQTLTADLRDLKIKKRINRLENISVRKVDILESWNEQGNDFAQVRFTANLLDYTVDEQSGEIVAGNNTEPVKFEEVWTFSRTTAQGLWQLVGITQV